jgi:hypothetical protein
MPSRQTPEYCHTVFSLEFDETRFQGVTKCSNQPCG